MIKSKDEFRERIRRQIRQAGALTGAQASSSQLTLERVESELAARGARGTPLELRLPDGLDMDGWAEIGRRLNRADQVMQWWLGDWAAFGLRKFEGISESLESEVSNLKSEGTAKPRRGALKEFAEANGINYGTLRNLAWVSSRVDLSRRRDRVEWSKHYEVASLSPREQSKWLARAESENMPRSILRQKIRLSQGEGNALDGDGPVMNSGGRYLDLLLAWLEGKEEEFWTAERREIWRGKLKAVVEFYQGLAAEV